MSLKALLSAVLISAAGLVSASPAEAGYDCTPRADFLGGGMECSGDGSDSWTVTPRADFLGGGYEKSGTIGGQRFNQTCTPNPDFLGGGYSCD